MKYTTMIQAAAILTACSLPWAASADQKTWNVSGTSGAWDYTTPNWDQDPTNFEQGDSALFADWSGTVTISSGGVEASSLSISNAEPASGWITFTGGKITLTGDLTVSNAHVDLEGIGSGSVLNGRVTLTGDSELKVGSSSRPRLGNISMTGADTKLLFAGGSQDEKLTYRFDGSGDNADRLSSEYVNMEFGAYAGADFSNFTSETEGGAISSANSVTLKSGQGLRFTGNSAGRGGAIDAGDLVSISSANGAILFDNNKSLNGYGGAIYADGDVILEGSLGVSFIGNNSFGNYGGAIDASNGSVNISSANGAILFENNKSVGYDGYGGAIDAGDAVILEGSRGVSFIGNSAGRGGAIYAEGHVNISSANGAILFENNTSSNYGGAIDAVDAVILEGSRGVSFIGNSAGRGGAIDAGDLVSISSANGAILFDGNSSGSDGGSISTYGDLYIKGGAASSFTNNSTSSFGGAIYFQPFSPQRSITLDATQADITFQGNIHRSGTSPTANAIYVDDSYKAATLNLIAGKGKAIYFYDPIVMQNEQQNASSLHFNQGKDCQGEIIFSGRDYADSDNAANYTSTLTGDAFQYNGTVRLDQRAALELVNYVQEGGTLAMGRRTSLTASGNVSLKTLTLDLSLSGEAASITAAGSASADRLTVYAPSSGVAPGETVLTITAASFGGILQETGDHQVAMRDDQGMNFLLEMNWDLNDEGALVFTTGDIVEEGVIAELQGSNIANSMLSSAATLRSFTGTGLEHLDTARFLSPLKSNVWTSGLGDFQMQRTKGGIEGFDYQGGGFAVGGDYKLGERWLGGVAYGYTSGKNISREYQATNRQNTNMGLIYTGWRLPMNKGQAVTITAAAGFSSTDNRLSSVTSGGQNSSGSWINRAWDGTVRAAWDIPVGKNLVLTPHIGVEYTDVVQEAFTESGEMARRFDRGHYRNLALPVGLSLTRGLTLGGMPWSHTVSVEYIPDVYRSNAGTYARLVSNGYGWGVDGSKPARQGVRAGISGRLQVTNNWSAYGSYQVEARDSFVNQRVMLGVGYSF